ncbi:MAG: right-handed parallel beta-helix repeat-containing protein [Deltaproteobacteria bacterium]|nr:right-handed parallel beta-helix repeat-containing protein [Deltaproteobacteria bacterium]
MSMIDGAAKRSFMCEWVSIVRSRRGSVATCGGLFAVGALLLSAIIHAPPARAGDGVREINQTCAVQTGCFSGDAAGFPVTIGGSAGRAFRLTSDLLLATATVDAISISASDVDLDLAGFSIRGPVSCSGDPIDCTPSSASGVGVSNSGLFNGVSVHGGSVVGMGVGVSLGNRAVVRELRVRSNSLEGVKALGDAKVESVLSYQNGNAGISISSGTVSGSISQDNGKAGLFYSGSAGTTGTARNNAVRANEDSGILALGTLLASGNVSTLNAGDGITGRIGSQVESNIASGNSGDGIQVSSESAILDNVVRANTGFGLRATGNRLAYRGNTINGNAAGTVSVVAPAVNQGANACNGVASCP